MQTHVVNDSLLDAVAFRSACSARLDCSPEGGFLQEAEISVEAEDPEGPALGASPNNSLILSAVERPWPASPHDVDSLISIRSNREGSTEK